MTPPVSLVEEGNSAEAPAPSDLPRYALLVEYDGTAYLGWQRQAHGPSVQGALEDAVGALAEKLRGSPRRHGDTEAGTEEERQKSEDDSPENHDGTTESGGSDAPAQSSIVNRQSSILRVDGAGRTDAGVHASGQVAAFSFSHILPERAIVHALNLALPPDIRILAARRVAADFDPRRHARRRRYVYTLAQGGSAPALGRAQIAWTPARLDWDRVRAALAACEGHHDFAAFRGPYCTSPRTELTLERARLLSLDPRGPAPEAGTLARFEFVSRSFLHNMVRLLVGAALECGRGRLTPERITEMLASASRGTTQLPPAPPEGLALVDVEYDPPLWKSAS